MSENEMCDEKIAPYVFDALVNFDSNMHSFLLNLERNESNIEEYKE